MTDDHKLAPLPEQQLAPQQTQVDFATVIGAVIDKDLTPEMLREVLTIHSEFNNAQRELAEKQAFTEAFVGLKGELYPVIGHDRKVDFQQTRFNYTTLAGLNAAVVPVMCKYGFAHRWIPSYDGGREVGITCQLVHTGGHCIEAYLPSTPTEKKGMSEAQKVMATQTTLKRNTLLSILGLATADMDDVAPPDAGAELAAWLGKHGHGQTVEEAEAVIGKPVAEFSAADKKKVGIWAQKEKDNG